VGAPGTARRAGRPGAIGLLELPGEARQRHDIAGAPHAGAAALAMRDQHVSQRPEAIAAAAHQLIRIESGRLGGRE